MFHSGHEVSNKKVRKLQPSLESRPRMRYGLPLMGWYGYGLRQENDMFDYSLQTILWFNGKVGFFFFNVSYFCSTRRLRLKIKLCWTTFDSAKLSKTMITFNFRWLSQGGYSTPRQLILQPTYGQSVE